MARHIPGIQNLQADQESRTVVDHSHWKLKREIFQFIRTLGPSGNRSFCIPPIVPDPKVRKLEARSRGGNSGCLYPRLGSIDGVWLPPFRISREMSFKTSHSPTSSEIGHSSPSMGNPTLVPIAPPTLCRSPSVTSTTCRSVDQAGGKSPPNPPSISRVACLNRSYSETGTSAEVRTLLMAAWRKTLQVPMGQLGKSGLAGVINNRLIPFQPLFQQY